jgi:hypothetical protein
MTTTQDGGKVVSLTHRPTLPPKKYTWYLFLLEDVDVCFQINTKHINTVWGEPTVVEC